MLGRGVDIAIGIVLLLFGILILIGRTGIEAFLPYLGLILIVLGVLMMLRVVGGGLLMGILVLLLGVALQKGWLDLPRQFQEASPIIDIIIGICLVVIGGLKVLGRR